MSSAAAGAPQGAPSGPTTLAQQKIEAGALLALGVACAVYLLNTLPALLFPSGMLASALTLLAGILLGVFGAAAALVLAFYHLTHPSGSSKRGQPAPQLLPRHMRRHTRGATAAATAPGPTLPHAIAVGGEFSGIVYTAPASAWRRTDTVGSWPPTGDPSQGPFKAWQATVAQGTLVLRPILPLPDAKANPPAQQGKPGSGAATAGPDAAPSAAPLAAAAALAAAGGTAAAAPSAPTKVGIPLEGCTLELVADGLRGRSEFIRRAPLLISHPRWPLLEGEPAFYLWADEPASKQQWLHALGWWCQDGDKLRAIQSMYDAYCDAMRGHSILDFPEQAPGATGGGAGEAGCAGAAAGAAAADGRALSAAAGAEQKAGKRGWKGWGASKVHNMKRKISERRQGASSSADGSAVGGPVGSPAKQPGGSLPASAAASPAKPPVAAPAELATLESFIDAKWMQSRKVQMPPAIPEAVVRSRHGSHPTSPKAIPRPPSASAGAEFGGSAGSLGARGSLSGVQVAGASNNGYVTPLLGSSPTAGSAGLGGGSPERAHGSDRSPAYLSSAAAAAALPPGSPLGKLERPSAEGEAHGEQQQLEADGKGIAAAAGAAAATPAGGSPRAADAPAAAESSFALPEGLPPLLSPDFAVNAFITRLAFDLLRRPDFEETIRARVQRQLSRLQRPDYIQALEVVEVAVGSAAPTLRNWRALPQPSAAIWPQVLFDMRYQGAFTVTIEVKLNIKDAAAWGRLDQALTRLAEGKRRGGGGQGEPGAPHHAASAPVLGSGSAGGDGEEDEYGEELEPLSPDSSAASEEVAQEGPGDGGGSGGRGFMGGIRHKAAKKLRQLAEHTAARISRIPLRLSLTFSLLEGTMCAWVPPPPGNRLFYAFVSPPHLELTARPELAPRLVKYSYQVARVSSWIEQRMRAAITKNIVFPGGGDIPLAALMGLDHPNAADRLAGLVQHAQKGAAAPRHRNLQQQQQQQQPQAPLQAAAERLPAPLPGVVEGRAADRPPANDSMKQEEQQEEEAVPAAKQTVPAAATLAAVPKTAQPAPAAMATLADQAGPAVAALRASSSSQHEELTVEPSLSLGSPQQQLEAAASQPGSGQQGTEGSSSDGHLISPRYGGSPDAQQLAEENALDLQPPMPAGQLRRHPTASDAWDAALAQEQAAEVPTPRFASQPWQQQSPQQQQQPGAQELQRVPAGAGPLSVGLGALQPGQRSEAASADGRMLARRPSLQLRLSATRSLDPDFVTSAEHTAFGEAPASTLPDYGAVRRTLSARVDGGASGASSARSGAGSTREAVGASIGRSLASLRRQSSLQQAQEGQAEASVHAGLQQASNGAVSRQEQQRLGQPEAGGDPRRPRQQGSFKEQAGKFFKQMNAAGKALASQMKDIQQQRGAAGGTARSGSSSGRKPASPAGSPGQPEQQQPRYM